MEDKNIASTELRLPTLSGIVPVSLFSYRLRTFNREIDPIVAGILPDNELVSINRTVSDSRDPIDAGIEPPREF